MVSLPQPVSEVDRECFDNVLSVPWLRASVAPTGAKWGKRIADVKVSRFPTHLLGQVMLIPSDEKNLLSEPLTDQVLLVVYRWDRYNYQGWSDAFSILLEFPDGSEYEVEVPPSFSLIDGHSLRILVSESTIVRERPQQLMRRIPRIVFNLSAPMTKQLSQEVRRLLKNVRKMTNLLQCTTLYVALEDEACRQEVEHSGIANFVEAYNSLRAPSYKADLVRYYLLYKYGGVYLDDKTLMRESLDSDPFDSIFGGDGSPGGVPCDLFVSSHRTPEIAFMGARRGSPIMLKSLEQAISQIMARVYTEHRLGITGNYLFTQVLHSGESTEEEPAQPPNPSPLAQDVGATWIRYWGEMCAILPIIFSNDGILVRDKFLWRRQAIPTSDWPRPATHYTSLWAQRQVYVDDNPPISSVRNFMSSGQWKLGVQIAIGVLVVMFVGFLISRYPPITWL